MYQLIIQDDGGQTTTVPLVREQLGIGRQADNAIRLTERNVSRHHARVLREGTSLYIEDLGSYTGTRLNGRNIQGRATLGAGDQVRIGDYQLSLQEVLLAPPPPLAVAPVVAPPQPPPPLERTAMVAVAPHKPGGHRTAASVGLFVGVACLCGWTVHTRLQRPQEIAAASQAPRPQPIAQAETPAPPRQEVPPPPAPGAPEPREQQDLVKPPPLRLRHHARRPDPVAARNDRGDQQGGQPGGQQDGQQGPAQRPGRGTDLSPEQAESLLQEAQGKYVNGDFAGAMRLAQRVTSAGEASATRAWRIIGASACNAPDLKMIHAAYQHIDTSSRQYVLYVCQRAGVAYSGGQFRLPESGGQSGG